MKHKRKISDAARAAMAAGGKAGTSEQKRKAGKLGYPAMIRAQAKRMGL